MQLTCVIVQVVYDIITFQTCDSVFSLFRIHWESCAFCKKLIGITGVFPGIMNLFFFSMCDGL
jgi:hypothetical protein